MAVPQAWSQICACEQYRGRWVALNQCRYDEASRPVEGHVVDADDDVVALCDRIRAAAVRDCAILFIDAGQRKSGVRFQAVRA